MMRIIEILLISQICNLTITAQNQVNDSIIRLEDLDNYLQVKAGQNEFSGAVLMVQSIGRPEMLTVD